MEVANKKASGRFADGGGLYLQVGPTGGKSWLFRYTLDGKPHEMGLGPIAAVSLKQAREKARGCREKLADGIDPLAARESARTANRLAAAGTKTFAECVAAYIKAHRVSWRNPKHADQWQNTIATYCNPIFGSLAVDRVDVQLVLRALEPIWTEKNETANRVRGRIEKVLDWARARGYRTGDNPARWRGHLDKLLAAPKKIRKVRHFAALPYSMLGTFMKELRAQESVSARALEFLILTAVRTSEAINARWDEIDLDQRVWTIPAERMKAKREHRVPLTDAALRVMGKRPKDGGFLFVGATQRTPLSNMAMLTLLKRMGREDLTVHGFRSTFRDWAAETTSFTREVAEAALAHTLSDKTEAAYRRGDLFEKRRKLMQAWANFCSSAADGKVVTLRRVASKR
jgi:integrase